MSKLSPETAARAVSKLALMAFFPSDPEVRAALVSVFLEMVETEEQMTWLATRALRLYARWPGVAELRALHCSRWKPKDGMEAYSEVYADGIPAERPAAQAPAWPRRGPATNDPEFAAKLKDTAKARSFPK